MWGEPSTKTEETKGRVLNIGAFIIYLNMRDQPLRLPLIIRGVREVIILFIIIMFVTMSG